MSTSVPTERKRVLVIGATGAQGIPVCRGLTSDGKYSLRILTRDRTSTRAKALLDSLPADTEVVEGTFANEDTLRAAFAGVWGAFVNLDGFNAGEKTELYWGIRAYELAIESGTVRFYVFGNLDYALAKAGYDRDLRAGHYDGKGRVGQWILDQNERVAKDFGLRAAIFTTGPYLEMAISKGTLLTPAVEKDEKTGADVLTWHLPINADAALAHVSLDDVAYYVRWLFDGYEKSDPRIVTGRGLDLEVAIAHEHYTEVAAAFTRATGKPARFLPIDLDSYFKYGLGPWADLPAGYNADPKDPATLSVRQNFTAFWNIWNRSGPSQGEKQVIKRDYKFLDEVHPGRIRSAEEFFRREDRKAKEAGFKGGLWEKLQGDNMDTVLKLSEDGRKGDL